MVSEVCMGNSPSTQISSMLLKKIHFYGGILLLIIFILSGQYMQHGFNRLQDMSSLERMIFRAEHIFLLFSALLHLAIGTYFTSHSAKPQKYIQAFSSLLMFGASALLLFSFFEEMPTTEIERSFSRMGLYLMLAGVSLHGLLSFWKGRPTESH